MTSPPSAPTTIEPSLDQRAAHAALTQVYARLPLSLVFTLGVSLLFCGLLLPFFARGDLLQWFVMIQSVGTARLVLLITYQRIRPGLAATRVWTAWFVVGAIAAAASWSAGAMMLLPPEPGPELTILCLTLLAVSSVAVSSLAPHYPSLLGFLVTALAPTAIVMLQRDAAIEIVIGYVLCAAIVALGWTGWQSCVAQRQQLRTDLELEVAVEQTRTAQQRAERASEAKSRFLATMSHELRTPLNGMLGLAELMERESPEPRHRRHLQLMRRSGESLRDILNEILDFSGIESERTTLQSVDFSLQGILQDITDLYASKQDDSATSLSLHSGIHPGVVVRGDRLRVRQILVNLVSNALKFTARGSIVIDAKLYPEPNMAAGNVATFRCEVRDTGIGIAMEDLERLFQPFTQLDDSGTRRFGGTGLGLAICKRLTELMGGRIGVESEPGKGSTFWFELPLQVVASAVSLDAPRQDALLQAPAATPAGAHGGRPRVLIVEDNQINQIVCSEVLRLLGIEFEIAAHGGDALEKAAGHRFDLVLMDLQMPVMDGHAATIELRRRGALARNGARLPIVALTANAFEEDRRRAAEAGMDAFLAKPVSIEVLAATLQRWLPIPPSADAGGAAA